MKQFFIVLLFLAGIASQNLQAQTIADTLEMAYCHFNKKEYKKSAEYFDYFLSKVMGQSKDYYLAGVCHANTDEQEKSIEYLNKAANGKAEYYMMLNDPELKAVQPQIAEIIGRFDNFDNLYKLILEKYPRNKSDLLAADSLYQLLPSGKIAKKQLRTVAYDFLSNVKDTVKYFYYLTEQLKTYQNKDERKELFNEMERSVKTYKNKVGAVTKEKLLAMGTYRYFYAMTFTGNTDSLRYHLSKVPYDVSMKYMPEDSYIGGFEYFTEQGYYDRAFSYLYAGLANNRIDTKKIFESKACNTFFKQPVGKTFLIMLLSENVIPTIESSDRVFVASAYEYSSSKRQNYEFMQAMNFNTRIPELKKYMVTRNVYGPKTAVGKSVMVSDSYPYGLYEDDLSVTIDTALNVTTVKKDAFDIFTPKDEVLVVKNTPAPNYAYTTGAFYRQPVANIPFILAVKSGKVKKSIIPSTRTEYFHKLVPHGIKSVFYNKPDRDDLRYFAFVYGYNAVESYFEELMRSPRKEDIESLAKFIPYLAVTRTTGFDFLARVLGNPEEFLVEKKNQSDDDTYYNLKKIASRYIEDLAGKEAFEDLRIGNRNRNAPKEEPKVWRDAATKITGWWDQYKKMTPYKLPTIVKATVTEQKGLPEDTKSLLLTASNNLLFYNPSEKEITPAKKEAKSVKEDPLMVEEVSIVVEEVETVRSSRNSNDVSGIMVGDTGYVFSPNHRDRPNNLSMIPGLTDNELSNLKQAYENLGLTKTGQNLIAGDYEKSFDKFYVCRYNKQLAVFWFTNATLYASFMGANGQLSQTPLSILHTREMKCDTNDTPYQEMVYNINSLHFEKLGNNLLVVCNIDIKEKPDCNNQKSRVYLELLGTDLKPLAEQSVFVEPGKSSDSDPATFVKTTANNAYVFVQTRKATNKVFGTVFNSKLEVADTFRFDQNIGGNYNPDPLTLIKADGDNIYCLYAQEFHGDVLLAMHKTGTGGLMSKPVYLFHSEGSLTDYKGYFSGGNFIVYLLERSFQKDRLKKVTIPTGLLKFGM